MNAFSPIEDFKKAKILAYHTERDSSRAEISSLFVAFMLKRPRILVKTKIVSILLFLLCIFPFERNATAQLKSTLELTDIYKMEYVSHPALSHDGKYIAYVRNFKDEQTDQNLSNVWLFSTDTGKHRPLTQGKHSDRSPVWTPKQNQLLFLSNKSGENELILHYIETGNEVVLWSGKYAPTDIDVTSDGKKIVFSQFVERPSVSPIPVPQKPQNATWSGPPLYIDDVTYRADGRGYLKEGNHQLFIMDLEPGTPVQLTNETSDLRSPQWADNGKTVIFSANLSENRALNRAQTDIFSLSVEDGTFLQLTQREGPDRSPVVSPNGKKIAYVGYEDTYLGYQQDRISIMDITGANSMMITLSTDRSFSNLQWSLDSNYLLAQYDDEGNTRVARIDFDGKVTPLVEKVGGLSMGRPYSGGSFSALSDKKIAFTEGTASHPAELSYYNGKKVQRLTKVNHDIFQQRHLGEVVEVSFTSSYDGLPLEGWMITPPNFDRSKQYPLLLEIHGGPFAAYGPWFSFELQHFAAQGYVVFYMNPRGSTGYGADFANKIHHNYPSQDYDDLMSGVDEIIKMGFIDSNRLFVTGGSGGGVLTAWIIGHTDRFKAAVVAKPVINWYSFVLYADNPATYYKYWFPGYPWEHQAHYMKRSPISYVGKVTTPTMVLTGEDDLRTPMAESEQYYGALQLQGIESALVRIPNASHGISSRPSNLISKIAAIEYWFKKFDNHHAD